ncbi:MAG TPA: AMP-dependent synthetase [Gammaproteobacteria bacterium]|nr:AMP-dependent synthetase [Gammaproteobacteria bacterium]
MTLTLTGLLVNTLKRHSDRIAVQIGSSNWTYAELNLLSTYLAASLQKEGVSHGDCVALYLRNCVEYVIADLAILKPGAVKVPLNEYQSASDLAHILDETEAKTLIAHQTLLSSLDSTISELTKLNLVVCVEEKDQSEIEQVRYWQELTTPADFIAPTISTEDVALISYTGGTTGKPKGVVQTQGSLAITLLSHVVSSELSLDEVMLLTTPLPHSAGYHRQSCLLHGGKNVLIDGFTTEKFFQTVETHGVTWTFLVPTMIYRLLGAHYPHDKSVSTLRTIVYGAAPMSVERLRQAIDLFGMCFIQLYGQTGSPNYITALTREDHANKQLLLSCGKPVAMAQVKTSAEDGVSIGEIIVRTPYLLKEYYRNEEATADTLRDGWLHTGDIGYIDENGYVFLQDRAKDMIISGGMNVYFVEVEQQLKNHPAVADAAVVGLPNEDWGEQVHAVVVASRAIDADSLITHCRERLSKYKVPKSIEFVDDLPHTAYGKIDKKQIKKQRQALSS